MPKTVRNIVYTTGAVLKPLQNLKREQVWDQDKRKNEIFFFLTANALTLKNTETKSAGTQKAVWLLQPRSTEITIQRVKQEHSSPWTEQKLFQAIASIMNILLTRPIKNNHRQIHKSRRSPPCLSKKW